MTDHHVGGRHTSVRKVTFSNQNNNSNRNRRRWSQDKYRSGKNKSRNLVQQFFSRANSFRRVEIRPSSSEEIIFKVHRDAKALHSRQTPAFCSTMGSTYKRQGDIVHCKRVPNPFSKSTSPDNKSKTTQFGETSNRFSLLRSERIAEEGSNFKICLRTSRIPQQSVPSGKKGWWSASCNKFERSESIYTVPALQNGRATLPQGHVEGKRLHVQTRLEGRLLKYPFVQGIKEICKVSVGWHPVRVHMPMFRSWSSTSNFYETFENTNDLVATTEHPSDHLLGRHVNSGTFTRGDYRQLPEHYFSITTDTRICDQSKEIDFSSMSENRIPRHDDRLHNYDNIASPGKNKKNTIQMFTLLPKPNIVSARVNKTIGTLDFHNTGSTSSKDPVTIPSAGTDHCLK